MTNSLEMIRTIRGVEIDPSNPDFTGVHEYDIAFSLSKIARFVGWTTGDKIYSVANHALFVEEILSVHLGIMDPLVLLIGLHHDDHEVITHDIPRPVKTWLRKHTNALEILQKDIQRAIHLRFGLPWPVSMEIIEVVKKADNLALSTEHKHLMTGTNPFEELYPPVPQTAEQMMPMEIVSARVQFLNRWERLHQQLNQ